MKMENRFRTKDLYLAASLYASGHKLINTSSQDKTIWLYFESKDGAQEASQQYWSGELQVSAKKYADAIRTLKDLIFSQQR